MHHISSDTDVLEDQLLRLLSAHKNGNPDAADEIFRILYTPEKLDLTPEIVPLLISALKVENETIRVVVNNTLASLREGATGAVNMLRDLAVNLSEDDFGALSAIRALGGIPGEASLEALAIVIESIDSWDSSKLDYALDALVPHAEVLRPYLQRVEDALAMLDGENDDCMRHMINRLRSIVRWAESGALGELILPGEFDFTDEGLSEQGIANVELIEHRTLPSGYGRIVNERIRFVLHGHGDVGLEIHRLNKNGDRYVVILSEDGESGVSSVSDALEYLASVVYAMYDLDPERTLWAERIAFESGMLQGDEDEYAIVTFQECDPSKARFRWPHWEPVANRSALFDRA